MFTCPYCTNRHGSENSCARWHQAIVEGDEVSCSDCGNWVPAGTLNEQNDGRLVCWKCQRAIDDAKYAKQQLEFFGQTSFF